MMIRIERTVSPDCRLSVDYDPLGNVPLGQALREMHKVAAFVEEWDEAATEVRDAATELRTARLDLAQGVGGRCVRAAAEIPALESALAEAEARLAEVEG